MWRQGVRQTRRVPETVTVGNAECCLTGLLIESQTCAQCPSGVQRIGCADRPASVVLVLFDFLETGAVFTLAGSGSEFFKAAPIGLLVAVMHSPLFIQLVEAGEFPNGWQFDFELSRNNRTGRDT
ncbi:hypothetical protein DN38_2543 [Vibrio cholerae]|nr:hypothetical protein DN38_2543 [Vibrio cholerae]